MASSTSSIGLTKTKAKFSASWTHPIRKQLTKYIARLMASWARVDVLLIDDFLIRPLNPDQAADTLEVVEDRAGLRSTVVTSQLPVNLWHEAMGEPTIADAVLDRLLQHLHRIELAGESMRRPEPGTATDAEPTGPSTPKRARQGR